MSTNELRADHHNAQAVKALLDSDKDIWKAAYHSCKQWGYYKFDGVKSIARDAQRSPSQIENYAHAFDLLATFHKCGHGLEVRRLKEQLTPSHFWKMWSLVLAHRKDITFWLQGLRNAVAHHWSGETMVEELLSELGAKRPPLKVATVRRNIANAASEILARVSDFTIQAERDAAQVVLNVFGDALQGSDEAG